MFSESDVEKLSADGRRVLRNVLQSEELKATNRTFEVNQYHHNRSVYAHTEHVVRVFSREFPAFSPVVLQHMGSAISGLPKRDLFLIALVLHDIGKPLTIRTDSGVTRCPDHERLGSYLVFCMLRGMGMPLGQVRYISDVVAYHGLVHRVIKHPTVDLDKDLYSIRSQTGDLFIDVVLSGYCDILGSDLLASDEGLYQRLVSRYRTLMGLH